MRIICKDDVHAPLKMGSKNSTSCMFAVLLTRCYVSVIFHIEHDIQTRRRMPSRQLMIARSSKRIVRRLKRIVRRSKRIVRRLKRRGLKNIGRGEEEVCR